MRMRVGPLFARGPRLAVRSGVLLFLALVCMVLDYQGRLSVVRSLLATLVYPLHAAITLPVSAGQWLSDNLATRSRLITEKSALEQRLFLLQPGLRRLADLEEENHRLRELLETRRRSADRMLMAELMAVNMQSHEHQITINKGDNVGAYVGQPIIDASGIMGQVSSTSAFSSRVRLVTDPLHALPIQVNRNGLRSIAMGIGDPQQLLLDALPVNADLQVGDLLVASGLGQRFPRGYPVGVVSKLVRDQGALFLRAMVRPSAELEKSREVLMVWPFSGAGTGGPP